MRGFKISQKSQNPLNACSKMKGRVFSEVAEAPQAAATQTHRAGRPLGNDGTLQIYNHLEKTHFLEKVESDL